MKKKINKYFMFLKVFKQNCRYCLFKSSMYGICSNCFKYFQYFLNPFTQYIDGMKIISMSRYMSKVKEEILDFKLRDKREISKFFILSIFSYPKLLSDLSRYEYITYVPMDENKEKYFRGYNQAKIIANDLSMFLGIPVVDLIEKVKKNKVQSSVRREYRKDNVRDVYIVKNGFNFNSILVVDDIYTTGATLFEIRKQILKKYNSRVDAFVLSKTLSFRRTDISLLNKKSKYYYIGMLKKKESINRLIERYR